MNDSKSYFKHLFACFPMFKSLVKVTLLDAMLDVKESYWCLF